MNKISAVGHIKAYLTDKSGNKRKVFDDKNTIQASLLAALAAHLDTNTDLALDNLFTTMATENYHDGIVFYATTVADSYIGIHSAVTTISQPTAIQFRATGVYTNNAAVSVKLLVPLLGKGWIIAVNPYGYDAGAFNDFIIASAPTWVTQTVPASEVLTLVWTITFTAH